MCVSYISIIRVCDCVCHTTSVCEGDCHVIVLRCKICICVSLYVCPCLCVHVVCMWCACLCECVWWLCMCLFLCMFGEGVPLLSTWCQITRWGIPPHMRKLSGYCGAIRINNSMSKRTFIDIDFFQCYSTIKIPITQQNN